MNRIIRGILLRSTKHLRLPHRIKWRIGALDEVAFWDDHIKQHYASPDGVAPSADGRFRTDPQAALQPELARLLADVVEPTVRILDVGCGPFPRVGKKLDGRQLELTAVDPLTSQYERLYKKHRVHPPVLPISGDGETLTTLFPRDHFHLAHANNCLDHGYDPVQAVTQMLEVVRPGGHVYLRHEANVAEGADYVGMHQWNFHIDANGHFIIRDRQHSVDMNALLGARAEIVSHMDGRFIITVMRKRTG